jgi:hypothetical protein
MTVVEFNVSDLVRNPSRVIEQAERGEVILHRRGRDDLRLTLASRETFSPVLNEVLARLVAWMMGTDAGRHEVQETMVSVLPWLRFLPEDARKECVQELVDVAVACASVGNFAAFQAEIASWQSTAEICSDPVLFAKLSGPVEIEHGGRVPIPDVPEGT